MSYHGVHLLGVGGSARAEVHLRPSDRPPDIHVDVPRVNYEKFSYTASSIEYVIPAPDIIDSYAMAALLMLRGVGLDIVEWVARSGTMSAYQRRRTRRRRRRKRLKKKPSRP